MVSRVCLLADSSSDCSETNSVFARCATRNDTQIGFQSDASHRARSHAVAGVQLRVQRKSTRFCKRPILSESHRSENYSQRRSTVSWRGAPLDGGRLL